MQSAKNYLEQELEELVQNDTSIFQFIGEYATDGMWYWDLENPEEEWMNANFWKTLGYDPQKMPHKSNAWKNIIDPDDLKTATENFLSHCENPKHAYDQIVKYTHQYGSPVWVRCRGIAVRNSEGKPIRMLGVHQDVTQLKKAQLQLDSELELKNQIIESSDIGTWEWDIEKETITVNEVWLNQINKPDKSGLEYSFNYWISLLHPESKQETLRELNDFLNGNTDKLYIETQLKTEKDDWIWVLFKGSITRRSIDGKPVILSATQQDITERKKHVLTLTKYKSIVETTNSIRGIGTWEVDLITKTSTWSSITKKIHETPDDFISTIDNGINFYKEGENRERITKLFTEAITSGKSFDSVFEIISYTGKNKWVRSIGVPIQENGTVISVNGLFEDLTKERELNEQLRLNEEQFRQTFDFAAIGMAIVSLTGKWVRVNRSLTKMLGYTATELMGTTFQNVTHPEDLKNDLSQLNQLVMGEIESYQMEKRYFAKDGSIVWVLLSVSMVKDNSGKPKHFVSQINNITDEKKAQQISDDSFRLLESQNTQLKNFAHIVSHNLRSHSSNLSMLADIFKTDHPESSNNDVFPLIENVSKSLSETILHLNEVVQIQMEEIELRPLKLFPAIQSTIDSLKGEIHYSKTKIELDIKEKIEIMGIAAYLDSIILNLITNAIKYKHPDRPPRIKISGVLKPNNTYSLSIRDNGIGFNQKNRVVTISI